MGQGTSRKGTVMAVHGPEALEPVSGEDRAAKRRGLPAGRGLVVFTLNIHMEKAHFVMGFQQVDTYYSAQGTT